MVTTAKSRFLIALGSNLGDRRDAIEAATRTIGRDLGVISARAPLYETAPIGVATQVFLNTALVCHAPGNAEITMHTLLAIEAALGRVRGTPGGDRVIDLDLLLWHQDGKTACTSHRGELATVPHPRMLERDFVLVPAANIAGDWRIKRCGPTLAELCAERGFSLTALMV